ncbi:hypothetical protein PYW07_008307 [Mythimna separata]|uniref:Luciferase n=1 Tax=Mythimna separata TaxID=271217 RepID=A0AAD7YDJ0_MYTSE|nr:hypothetical protein PYW07_008307 [Mythimna separata]
MSLRTLSNDSVHWYMQELTSRVVAQSGIPSDRYHLGKIILQSLKDAPDFVLQIDGATGQSESCGSVLERSVRCAQSLRRLGLKRGDVVMLLAPNHLDVTIPLYAALYLGIAVTAFTPTATINELQEIFAVTKPNIIFCQNEVASRAQLTLDNLNLNAHIITFDKSDDFCTFTDFMEQYGDDTPTKDFKCSDFDPEESIAFMLATSGTTGVPKIVAHSHKYFTIVMPYTWSRCKRFPTPTRLVFVCSPIQWSTAMYNFIRSPILRYTRLQTSVTMTREHACYLNNTYKPTYTILTPTMMAMFLVPADDSRDIFDLTCFELIMLCGLYVAQSLIDEVKAVSPKTEVLNIYGLSELSGLAFLGDNPAPGSCGKPMGCFQYRLMNIDTNQEIYKPNVPGELWIKGPCPAKGYYNNIEATKETFTKDGWLKTGDIFYRDEQWNFFYMDRIKLLIKGHYLAISPLEIEAVIRKHAGVSDVAVTSITHNKLGDLPVAFVVPRPGAQPSADEIKNLVRDSLGERKRLQGGVIFINSLPMTASSKVDRRKLKELALVLPRA